MGLPIAVVWKVSGPETPRYALPAAHLSPFFSPFSFFFSLPLFSPRADAGTQMKRGNENVANQSEDLAKLKLPDLKARLKAAGKPVTGSKAQLVARLRGQPEPAKKPRNAGAAGPFNLAEMAKKFKAQGKAFHKLVDADWHDGYEEQEEFMGLRHQEHLHIMEHVVENAVSGAVPARLLSTVLCEVHNAVELLNSVPYRGGDADMPTGFGKLDLEHSVVLAYSWHHVLLRAGVEGDAAIVDAIIKEAADRVPRNMSWTTFTDVEYCMEFPPISNADLLRGAPLVAERYEAEEYAKFPSTVKTHKRKKVIDRRFDGPKNRRTRDFSDLDGFW